MPTYFRRAVLRELLGNAVSQEPPGDGTRWFRAWGERRSPNPNCKFGDYLASVPSPSGRTMKYDVFY
ncbi:unnamed protein product [Protopolystoma xenopodis]|uniref:Uncharacterized protein n=1 Tax=Protopolystoma xenopodis TaxID=117903 RepID=A0A3S5B7H5_9PLAT|nr:unnamed protein product [Protopolystoma xenopodis]